MTSTIGSNPSDHFFELADGSRRNNLAKKRGDAEIMLQDTAGNPMRVTLKGALYVPSFPHDIFSVKAATKQGAEIKLKDGHNTLTKNGTSFHH